MTSIINPFTHRKIKSSSPIAKILSNKGLLTEEYVDQESYIFKSKSKITLKKHQKDVVNHFHKNRSLIAIHSLGSGKTITSIAASIEYLDKDPNNKVIVLTSSTLESSFRNELEFYYDNTYGSNPVYLSRYLVMSYDKFSRNHEKYKMMKNYFLIIDEAHNLRTTISKNTGVKALRVLNFAIKADKVLLLTATPFYNSPYDIINLVAMTNKRQKIISKEIFDKYLYSDERESFFRFLFKDIISIYNPSKHTLKDSYPTYKINEVMIKMPESYLKIYRLLEKNSKSVESYYKNPNIFFNGLRQASNKIEDEILSPKIEWIIDFLNIHPNEKTLIFSNWVKSGVRYIQKNLKNDDLMIIDGNTKKNNRKLYIYEYNTNPSKNILLISKTGGEGLDLKNTQNLIILDPSWNNSVDTQVIGRAVRFESHKDLPLDKRHVNVYQLFLLKPNEHHDITLGKYRKYLNTDNRILSTERWSVDLYLRALSKEKDRLLREFMKYNVAPYSISEEK